MGGGMITALGGSASSERNFVRTAVFSSRSNRIWLSRRSGWGRKEEREKRGWRCIMAAQDGRGGLGRLRII